MTQTMCCRCGHEEDVHPDQMAVGAVWRCSACGEYVARVIARDGRMEWVVLDKGYAEFKRLTAEPEVEVMQSADYVVHPRYLTASDLEALKLMEPITFRGLQEACHRALFNKRDYREARDEILRRTYRPGKSP